ncbi:factor associated with metabolism and energy isoform X3 [Saimiri boliviensis]|uniref:factor associated with metabolism and energy isoform X3 n=1 Tax=Saimiri boliviensis TaxID=27679 RepID=UPI003D7768B6
MGLSHSKARPRVIKVAPLQNKEVETPSAGPVDFACNQNLEEKTSYSLARLQDRNKALEGQLPPLQETWYGRYSAASRDVYFDIPLEHRETSIIKRHPPQRLQRLEPIDLPRVITSGRLLSQREARTMYKAKAQMELKESLHGEARINKQSPKDHKAKKILQSTPRNDAHHLLTMLPDEILNRGPGEPGNSQNAQFFKHPSVNDYCPWKTGKMETWLHEQETQGRLLWDSSSSDSDELRKDEKKPRALFLTGHGLDQHPSAAQGFADPGPGGSIGEYPHRKAPSRWIRCTP